MSFVCPVYWRLTSKDHNFYDMHCAAVLYAGPLLQPRGQTSVFYSVPPANDGTVEKVHSNSPDSSNSGGLDSSAVQPAQGHRQGHKTGQSSSSSSSGSGNQ